MEGSRVDLLSGTHGKEDQRRILLYRKGTEAIDQQFRPQLPKLDKRRQMSEVQDAYFMGRPHLYANMENMGRARENRRPQTAHRFRKDRTRRRPTRTAAKSDRTKRKINGNFTHNHTGRREHRRPYFLPSRHRPPFQIQFFRRKFCATRRERTTGNSSR